MRQKESQNHQMPLSSKPKHFNKNLIDREQEQQLNQKDDEHALRKEYIPKIYRLIKRWLLFLGFFLSIYTLLLSCVDIVIEIPIQILPGYVLVALLGTSTAIVFGLFVIAAK